MEKAPGQMPNKEPSKEERIDAILKKGVAEILVHGDYNAKGDFVLRPDLDAKLGAYIFGLSDVSHKMVRAIPKGSMVEKGMHIDTGGRPELTIEDDGTVFFDHHGDTKGAPTSAAQIVYETLVKTGHLKKEKWLGELTRFSTEMDNLSYPLDGKFLQQDWWRTPYGLYKVLPFDFMVDLFKKGRDPRKPFTMKESAETKVVIKGKEQSLNDVCNKNKDMLILTGKNMEKAVQDMKAKGIRTETPELGSVVLNKIEEQKDFKTGKTRIMNRMPHGKEVTRAFGHTYVLWNSAEKSFFVGAREGADLTSVYARVVKAIPDAKLIRGVMIVFPRTVQERNFDLDTLLTALELK